MNLSEKPQGVMILHRLSDGDLIKEIELEKLPVGRVLAKYLLVCEIAYYESTYYNLK